MPPGEAILAAAKLVFWELSLTAFALVLTRKVELLPERLALLIGFNITANALAATLFSFLGINSGGNYLALGAIFLVASGIFRAATVRERFLPPAAVTASPVVIFVCSCALLTLLAAAMRPVEELDSLYNLHYVMGWYQNKTTPYVFAFNYVPFCELSYLPGLALARGDVFIWWSSLKPILLLGLALLLIAREVALPRNLTVWTLGALLAFPHLWLGPSGVSTIKNDMIHAAGQAIAALICLRTAGGTLRRIDAALATLAVVFISVKFSGPVMLAAGAVVTVVLAFGWIRRNIRRVAALSAACAAVWLITVGHYYLRNFLVYGSPLYPFQINVWFLHLPGRADLSYSSILYNLHDPRLWRAFFLPINGISPAGVLFPAIFLVIIVGSAAILAYALVRRRPVTVLTAAALFQLVVWGVYFRSVYSASGYPGDLAFVINDLNSIRYVEGALLVAELLLVSLLVRKGAPAALIYALIAIQGVSRLWLLLRREPEVHWLIALALALTITLLVLRMGRHWKVACAATLLAGILAAGPWLIERRRPQWLARFQPLYLPLYEAPASNVFLLLDDEYSQQPCAQFPLMGRRFQHNVDTGSYEDLQKHEAADYVTWVRRQDSDVPRSLEPGYKVKVNATAGVLYEQRGGR